MGQTIVGVWRVGALGLSLWLTYLYAAAAQMWLEPMIGDWVRNTFGRDGETIMVAVSGFALFAIAHLALSKVGGAFLEQRLTARGGRSVKHRTAHIVILALALGLWWLLKFKPVGAALGLALWLWLEWSLIWLIRDKEGFADRFTRRRVEGFWSVVRGVLAFCSLFFVVVVLQRTTTINVTSWINAPFSYRTVLWGLGYVYVFAVLYMGWTIAISAIGTRLRPISEGLRMGQGGSGGWTGLLEEWTMRFDASNPKFSMALGKSLYEKGQWIGQTDDRHVLTVAGSGGGKGVSLILPNLLTWQGSAIVVDPKGTNAIVSGARRGSGGGRVSKRKSLGQAVYCVNPFKVNEGKAGMPPSARFNPLTMIDIEGPSPFEDIKVIAEALVVGNDRDPFWSNSARGVIGGSLYYLLKRRIERMRAEAIDLPPVTLGDLRDFLIQRDGLPLDDMHRIGGMSREAAAQLINASDKALGDILSETLLQTNWLSESSAVRDCLAANDFELSELKEKACTVYLVIPPHLLDTHSRLLRLFINCTIIAGSRGGKSKLPILMVMDEFFSLGRLELVETAAANIRSYGIRLWPIVQNLGQIAQLYSKNWQGFEANSATTIYFSTNDPESYDWVANRLGSHVVQAKDADGNLVAGSYAWLLSGEEVTRAVGRAGGELIAFREGRRPLRLEKLVYFKDMPKGLFNLDPDHA